MLFLFCYLCICLFWFFKTKGFFSSSPSSSSLSLFLLCVDVLFACISVNHMHAWCPWKPEEDVRCPRIIISDSCEPLRSSGSAAISPAFVYFVCVCMCGDLHATACVKVRRQSLPLCGFCGWNSGCQAWRQVPLPTEPSLSGKPF